MAQVCFLNRDRANWLWAFSFIVMLLPLTLGQSSAGGCGASVSAPNPEPVDSDGDGFSDNAEHNGNPGTDPNDPTDNPNHVRYSDADECSDYDEENFDFCDSDPYTPDDSGRACDGLSAGAFYNDEFGYGFEIPRLADLTDYDDSPNSLFNSGWRIPIGTFDFGLATWVSETDESSGLDDATVLDWEVSDLYSHASFTVHSQDQVTVGGGGPAYLTVFEADVRPDLISYQLLTVRDLRLYVLQAVILKVLLNDTTEAVITDTLLSLCVN